MSAPTDGNLYALNASNGALLWSYKTGDYGGAARRGERVVYVGSADGTVCAERQHRRQAVELLHWTCWIAFARGGEWSGLFQLGD